MILAREIHPPVAILARALCLGDKCTTAAAAACLSACLLGRTNKLARTYTRARAHSGRQKTGGTQRFMIAQTDASSPREGAQLSYHGQATKLKICVPQNVNAKREVEVENGKVGGTGSGG